jgi:hypothetical protein
VTRSSLGEVQDPLSGLLHVLFNVGYGSTKG